MGSRRHRATLAHEYILPLLRTMINQFLRIGAMPRRARQATGYALHGLPSATGPEIRTVKSYSL